MRRSLSSLGTPGGRLAVSVAVLAAVAILAITAIVVGWLRPTDTLRAEVIQDGLEFPWDIAFAADGRMLVTERAGRILVFADASADAPLLHATAVPGVQAQLESGLMGIAIHDQTVYVCATRGDDPNDPDRWRVDILRTSLASDSSLSPFEPLPIGQAQGAPRHQGCAVEIGPDELLWLTIGDANLPSGRNRSQDAASLNGKVLRFTLDGTVPADAAFPSGAVSLGHRNPQGLAFRDDGLIVEVEHGTDVDDEVNVIVPGANYGYPCVTGMGSSGPIPSPCPNPDVFRSPAWASGAPTLATSAATFLGGSGWRDWAEDLVVSTLKEEDLRRFSVATDGSVTLEEVLLDRRFGRLRATVLGPDGALYVSTSNGTDDRIVRITRD